ASFRVAAVGGDIASLAGSLSTLGRLRGRIRRRRGLDRRLAAPAHYFIGVDRPVEALQAQLTDMRGSHRLFDGAERALTYHDLAGLGLAAQPRSEIYNAADRGVFAPMLEADLAERRVAGCDADAESEHVAHARPLLRQLVHPLAHVERQADRALGVVVARNRIVEDNHDAVSEEPLQRALISEDKLAQVLVVLAQNAHDLFGLGRLGEGGEAA